MSSSDTRPETDPMHVMLRGLTLGLRHQADRILRSVPDYYTVYGVLAEARAALELLENLIEQALEPGDGESNQPEAAIEGAKEYDGGGLYL